MTLGESQRRYGRPVLTAQKLKDRVWECEDRIRYYGLMYKNIETQLETLELTPAEFDGLYARLLEAERFREIYATEACLLNFEATAERFPPPSPRPLHPANTENALPLINGECGEYERSTYSPSESPILQGLKPIGGVRGVDIYNI